MIEPLFLLDTNILIYLAERQSPSLSARVQGCSEGELVTSSVAFAEFVVGVDWSRPHAEDSVARLFSVIEIVPFDRDAAIAYSRLPFLRHRFDRLIAAHALALRLTLVTANPRDFRDLAGLKVEDWTR